MKIQLLFAFLISLAFAACKKKDQPEEEVHDGSYPGKIKSINNTAWQFLYDESGQLIQYNYFYYGIIKSAKLTWENGQVTCNDGIGYTYLRPRNNAGYAIPGNDDQQVGNNWTYNAANQLNYLNGISYHWSNGNIDSLTFGSTVTHFEYSTAIDNRDMGARFVPYLTNFPVYNLNPLNVITKASQLDGNGDTISIRLYTHTFNAQNRMTQETQYLISNGDTTFSTQYNYVYYE